MKWSNTNNSGKSHTYNTRYNRFKSSFNGRRFPIYPTQPTECTAIQSAKTTEITIKNNKKPETYTYNRGDGNKFMSSTILWHRASPLDTLKFDQGITREDLRFSQDHSNNLVITINGSTSDRIIIKNFMSPYRAGAYKDSFNQIDVGGYTLSNFDVRRAINAGEQPKWPSEIIAKKINDSRVYTYNIGDGDKIINNRTEWHSSTPQDTLKFGQGITKEDISFSFSKSNPLNLEISIKGATPSRITIEGFRCYPHQSMKYDNAFEKFEVGGYRFSAFDVVFPVMFNKQPEWSPTPTPTEIINNKYAQNEQLTNLASQFSNKSEYESSSPYLPTTQLGHDTFYTSGFYNPPLIS